MPAASTAPSRARAIACAHAEIGHVHLGPRNACERVDRREAGTEAAHHLRGDVGGIGADAVARNAVITRADEDRAPFVGVRGDAAGDRAQAHRELFEAPEAPERFDQRIDARARRRGVRRFGRRDHRAHVVDHAVSTGCARSLIAPTVHPAANDPRSRTMLAGASRTRTAMSSVS
jgi:hypothetical protein